MRSPEHVAYRKHLLEWSRNHAEQPDVVAGLERYKEAALVLWHLDLAPARPFLQQ